MLTDIESKIYGYWLSSGLDMCPLIYSYGQMSVEATRDALQAFWSLTKDEQAEIADIFNTKCLTYETYMNEINILSMPSMNNHDNADKIRGILSKCTFSGSTPVYTMGELMTMEFQVKTHNTNSKLDNLVGIDGFESKRLYVFAGYEKSGKSLTLLNLAYRLANENKDAKVLYLTLENSLADTQRRLSKFPANMDYPNPDVGRAPLGTLHIAYIDKATCDDVGRLIDGYDIAVIDYLGRILPSQSQMEKSRYDLLGEYCDYLHQYADSHDMTIITAAQLTRDARTLVESAKNWTYGFLNITSSHLADSINIGRNADSVIISLRRIDPTGVARQFFHTVNSRIPYSIEAMEMQFDCGNDDDYGQYSGIAYLWDSGVEL